MNRCKWMRSPKDRVHGKHTEDLLGANRRVVHACVHIDTHLDKLLACCLLV